MSYGGVDVLVNAQTEKRKITISLTEIVSLLARVRGGTGNSVFLIGYRKSIQSRMSVLKILRHALWNVRKKWNQSFSPLEVGKQWFYREIEKRWQLLTLQGWETKEIRDRLGLKKSSKKLSETFEAHCVNSWCLAYHTVGGRDIPDNTNIFCIASIPIRRRELHRQNPQKGGKRPRYGGTTSNGLVKNTLVKHAKYGLTRISGFSKQGISLYSLEGKRLCQNAKTQDFKVLTRLNFNYRSGVSSPS